MRCTTHFHRHAVRTYRNACVAGARVSRAAWAGQTHNSSGIDHKKVKHSMKRNCRLAQSGHFVLKPLPILDGTSCDYNNVLPRKCLARFGSSLAVVAAQFSRLNFRVQELDLQA
jgi:hypothetical protein